MTESNLSKPGSRFTIEPATWRDLNGLRHVEKACFPQDVWPLWDLIGVLTLPNVIRLKAVVGDTMVGFVAGDVRRTEKFAWIATIGVLPEYQGQGIGGALLQACEDQIEMPIIRLVVRKSNATAISLYKHRGYQAVDQMTRYYNDGEDGLVMEKLLRRQRS